MSWGVTCMSHSISVWSRNSGNLNFTLVCPLVEKLPDAVLHVRWSDVLIRNLRAAFSLMRHSLPPLSKSAVTRIGFTAPNVLFMSTFIVGIFLSRRGLFLRDCPSKMDQIDRFSAYWDASLTPSLMHSSRLSYFGSFVFGVVVEWELSSSLLL